LEEERDIIDKNEYTSSSCGVSNVKKNDGFAFQDLNGE
jgi:hypothetical protein